MVAPPSREIKITLLRRYVINRKCYITEGYVFHNNLFMRTYPAPCRPESAKVSHMLQTISVTAWLDNLGKEYMLVYIGHGEEFAEAVWVRREEVMIRYDENFTVPIFLYDDHIEDTN